MYRLRMIEKQAQALLTSPSFTVELLVSVLVSSSTLLCALLLMNLSSRHF